MEKFTIPIPPPTKPGKYRRSFNWRFNENRERSTAQFSAILSLSQSESLDILEDYLYISRKRSANRTAMERLQSHLIGEHLSAESAIKVLKEQLTAISTPGTEEPDPAALPLNQKIQELRLYANCLRVIGDGIAWRALGYDRAALRALSGNRGCQNLMSEGLAYELMEWSSHFERSDAVAIVNALTNWLTTGDVTVIEKNGAVEVVEVKSGQTKSSRIVRQRQALRQVDSFLNTGLRIEDQGKHVQAYDLNIEAEHGLDVLETLLTQAERSGYAMKEINSFYLVDCIDSRFQSKLSKETFHTELEQRTKKWVEKEGDDRVRQTSVEYLTFTPLIAPFSIFPLPERTCLELMLGIKFYAVTTNLGAIARAFERRGWRAVTPEERVQKKAENNPEDPIARTEGLLVVQKDGVTIGVPVNDISRMQMELMRPQVLVKVYDKLKSLSSSEGGRNYVDYKLQESHIWR